MSNVMPSFWQKTLQSFGDKQVRVMLRDRKVHEGRLEVVGGTAAHLRTFSPEPVVIAYSDLLEVEEIKPWRKEKAE